MRVDNGNEVVFNAMVSRGTMMVSCEKYRSSDGGSTLVHYAKQLSSVAARWLHVCNSRTIANIVCFW